MNTRILIIGGYGNFGSFIAKMLAREEHITLIIAGRNSDKANAYAATLNAEAARLDIYDGLAESLATIAPDIVIHTSGPYQGQSYHVAEACIAQGTHYIDLADARDFVANITSLDAQAKEKNLLICSGASSVPCLTSAIIDHYKAEFKTLTKVEYAISTAQRTNRGLATTAAVLSYAGKSFTTLIDGTMQPIFGWMDNTSRKFWKLNTRYTSNCDIPDLAIFPSRYPELRTIRFRAGLELSFMQFMLAGLSQLVKWNMLSSLDRFAKPLLKTSFLCDWLGTDNSGFYMTLTGITEDGAPKTTTFDLVAKDGDGLYIPSMPAILLAAKLANGTISTTGASPCVDLITLDEYLKGLSEFNIAWQTSE